MTSDQAAEEWAEQFYEKPAGFLRACRVCGAVIDHRRQLQHATFHGKRPPNQASGKRTE